MPANILKILLVIFILALASVQSAGFISIASVKVNLILALLVTLSFFIEGLGSYLLLLLFGSFIISTKPGLSQEFTALFIAGLVALFLRKKFFSPSLATNAIAILLANFAFYLILSPSFIANPVFFIELGLNEITGAIFFLLIARLTGKNSQRRSS
jgi:hypothetical protein